ncbi:MAG: hypothetical protein HPY57_15830 [Ignavibacteria bacterium]|nr:hypothetical protein [Ignavibacteria bacterium]
MATLHKFNRLLVIHGIDPIKANIIKVEQKPELSQVTVHVEFEGVEYLLNETTKQIINKETKQIETNRWEITRNNVKKPRGWHFRDVFVDSEGNVYHKGIEQPQLKGTLPPSE